MPKFRFSIHKKHIAFALVPLFFISIAVLLGLQHSRPVVTVIKCIFCHDTDALALPRSDETKAERDWMKQAGEGMVQAVPITQTLQEYYIFKWVKRGRHTESEIGDCSPCHGTLNGPEGHARHLYPSDGCAQSTYCHAWLGKQVHSEGFTNSQGETSVYDGSIRPIDLFTGAENAHREIYKKGYVNNGNDPIAVRALMPGCQGCHNAFKAEHGAIPRCVDCHQFSKGSHQIHIAAITAEGARRDPAHAKDQVCVYCHNFTEDGQTSDGLYKAACYNCHLSGHQPLNGKVAQYWQ